MFKVLNCLKIAFIISLIISPIANASWRFTGSGTIACETNGFGVVKRSGSIGFGPYETFQQCAAGRNAVLSMRSYAGCRLRDRVKIN